MLGTIGGVIARRLLINYRVDPEVLARQLPVPFRPRIYRGVGLVGICLIRLEQIRPLWLPAWLGISSENVAHRAAVEWDEDGSSQTGVFIRRRDTDSWLNAAAGGKIFPGAHHHARIEAAESAERIAMKIASDDGATQIRLAAGRSDRFSPTSVFTSLDEASAFFEAGSIGYSATFDPGRFEGLELRCRNWRAEPLDVEQVESSYFDDESLFPRGTLEFDGALYMSGIEHEWHSRPEMRAREETPHIREVARR